MEDTIPLIRNSISWNACSAASAKGPINTSFPNLIPTLASTIKKDILGKTQTVFHAYFAYAIVRLKLHSSFSMKKLPLQNALASLNLYNLDAV